MSNETNQTSAKLQDRIRGFTDKSNGFEGQYVPKAARELLYEAADRLEAYERGEIICIKCGLRQDAQDQTKGEF